MNNRQLHPNLVRVYWNLTSNTYSVQKYIKGTGWRLSHHTDHINLVDVEFICSHATRLRVIREQKKYVHAYFEGFDYPEPKIVEGSNWGKSYWGNQITYNPFKFPNFTGESDRYGNPFYEYGKLSDQSVINSFWDLFDSVPRRYCEILTMSIDNKKPRMIAGIRV